MQFHCTYLVKLHRNTSIIPFFLVSFHIIAGIIYFLIFVDFHVAVLHLGEGSRTLLHLNL